MRNYFQSKPKKKKEKIHNFQVHGECVKGRHRSRACSNSLRSSSRRAEKHRGLMRLTIERKRVVSGNRRRSLFISRDVHITRVYSFTCIYRTQWGCVSAIECKYRETRNYIIISPVPAVCVSFFK